MVANCCYCQSQSNYKPLEICNSLSYFGKMSINRLTNLQISSESALQELHCDYNLLTSLDLSSDTKLWEISCSNNQLTNLNLTNDTSLQLIFCGNNNLSSIDLSTNKNLRNLSIEHNLLTMLDISMDKLCSSVTATNNVNLFCIQVYKHFIYTYSTIDFYARFSLNCGYPQPLTLLFFDGNATNNKVLLKWTSANETNTTKFIIESSADGKSFAAIGTVTAKGGGSYNYIDNTPPTAYQVYYRLKMIDKDGSYAYSKVISVQLPVNSNGLTLFPNPTTNVLNVQYNHSKTETVIMQVIDMLGRVLEQQQVNLSAGTNIISLPVASLTKGSYRVVIKGGGVVQTKGFVKE